MIALESAGCLWSSKERGSRSETTTTGQGHGLSIRTLDPIRNSVLRRTSPTRFRLLPILGNVSAMAQNTSISLDAHFVDFLAQEVSTGRYRSASEVVRAGLRLLEDQEAQMSALRAALIAGEESGAPEPFDFDAFIASKKS